MGHVLTLVSSHGMLKGLNVDRDSQNFIVCPSCLMLQIFNRAYLSTSFMALKFKIAVLGIPGMHATRWLDGVLIVFLKRLADFMKKMKCCTIPTWKKFNFLHRNSKSVILTKYIRILHWLLEMCRSIAFVQFLWTGTHDPSSNPRNQLCVHIPERVLWEWGGRGCSSLETNKISKLRPQSCDEPNSESYRGHWVVKTQ